MLHFLSHVQSILMRETSRTDGISRIHCEGDVHRAMSDCPSGCSALGGLEFRHGSDLELPVVEWRSRRMGDERIAFSMRVCFEYADVLGWSES